MASRTYDPAHPGKVIRDLCIEPLGITITDAADGLGVSRKTLSAIINGRAGVSAEMALRLAKAFNTSAEMWLKMQQKHDLWQASQRGVDKDVKPLVAA